MPEPEVYEILNCWFAGGRLILSTLEHGEIWLECDTEVLAKMQHEISAELMERPEDE